MPIVSVEEPALLITMDPVIGRVEVQDQFLRPAPAEGSNELLDQHPVDGRCRGPVGLPLQPAKRGAAGQRLAALHRRLPRQVMPQGIMVNLPKAGSRTAETRRLYARCVVYNIHGGIFLEEMVPPFWRLKKYKPFLILEQSCLT